MKFCNCARHHLNCQEIKIAVIQHKVTTAKLFICSQLVIADFSQYYMNIYAASADRQNDTLVCNVIASTT